MLYLTIINCLRSLLCYLNLKKIWLGETEREYDWLVEKNKYKWLNNIRKQIDKTYFIFDLRNAKKKYYCSL